ncbi:MAG TPA: preprotein translocase subunit SecE [Candidatus Paceibacterota bacterium]|nr:preprotein translocase subunit SecE [Candidatus Paceibacterota bacterium]
MSLGTYLKETKGELKHMSWPTTSQIIAYSVAVIVISAFTALYLGFFDYLFTLALNKFILR